MDAPGGTGKTFLLKMLLAKVRSMGKTAIAAASSGIAATLLPGGKTAHSAFKIPLNLNTDKPTCFVSLNSKEGNAIRECSLIIWDKCTMADKRGIEAVHWSLVDLRQPEKFQTTANMYYGWSNVFVFR